MVTFWGSGATDPTCVGLAVFAGGAESYVARNKNVLTIAKLAKRMLRLVWEGAITVLFLRLNSQGSRSRYSQAQSRATLERACVDIQGFAHQGFTAVRGVES